MLKPEPRPTAETRPFWDACKRGELLFQRCAGCGRVQFYPRGHCTACQSHELAWERSAGQGTIYSYTVVHRAPTEAFRAEVPYVLALVDMAEGFRIMTNVRGAAPDAVAIGRPVRIVFEPTAGGEALPQAELAG